MTPILRVAIAWLADDLGVPAAWIPRSVPRGALAFVVGVGVAVAVALWPS